MADNTRTVHQDELGPDGFVVRDAVPTSDVIRIRFADIDGLRALAILLVSFSVLVHYTMQAPSALLLRVAAATSQGLALFLVVSGFALAFPAMAVLRQDGRTYLDVGRYAIRRLLRIYPAYLVALALTVALASYGSQHNAAGFHGVTPGAIVANVFFLGDGFGNEGFRVLGLFMRAYIFFPALVWLWTKRPAAFAGLGVVLAILDVATPAHAWSLGAYVPFMLGIVAADLRAQVHRFERIAPAIAIVAALVAVFAGPFLAQMPGVQDAPLAPNVDPFWSIFAFGLVVSVAAYRPLEQIFSFWMLRVLGASSYSVSLVIVPVAGLLAATVPFYSVGLVLPLGFVAGFAFWQLVDRWFNDGDFRRNAATAYAGPVDGALANVRADRVFLGGAPGAHDDDLPEEHQEEFVPNFYAPPPRASAADLAIVSRRTGSPEELQAEILETKARLQERSNALFAEDEALRNAVPPPVFAKPGFYRKPAKDGDTPGSQTGLEPMPGHEPEPEVQPPTIKHTISAAPKPAAVRPEETRTPELEPEPQQASNPSGNGPAIRIRISTPTDGVVKNG